MPGISLPRALALLLLLGSLTACSVLRLPPDPRAGLQSVTASRLLSSEPPRLVVEVDVVEGAKLTDRGLALWRLSLMERIPKREIIVRRDQTIPAEDWKGMDQLKELTHRYRQVDESGEQDALYVLVAPEDRGMRGWGWSRAPHRPLPRAHPDIIILSKPLHGILWLTRSAQEASALLHETGHVLGLVTAADHAQGLHCTHGECLMTNGASLPSILALGPGILLGKMPMRWCSACRQDLWGEASEGDARPPAERVDDARALAIGAPESSPPPATQAGPELAP